MAYGTDSLHDNSLYMPLKASNPCLTLLVAHWIWLLCPIYSISKRNVEVTFKCNELTKNYFLFFLYTCCIRFHVNHQPINTIVTTNLVAGFTHNAPLSDNTMDYGNCGVNIHRIFLIFSSLTSRSSDFCWFALLVLVCCFLLEFFWSWS